MDRALVSFEITLERRLIILTNCKLQGVADHHNSLNFETDGYRRKHVYLFLQSGREVQSIVYLVDMFIALYPIKLPILY